jgi:hypothetical protein
MKEKISMWKKYPHIEKVADRELTMVLLNNVHSLPMEDRHEYLLWVNETLREADEAIIEELGLYE